MREIKFRAKRIDMDRWIYGQYFITPLTDENSGTTPDKGWFFLTGEPRHCIVQNMVCFVIDEKTLGQYTGLKDKNGKEIYEGDVVKGKTYLGNMEVFTRFIGQVKYIAPKYVVDGVNKYLNCREDFDSSYEVIGNIFENDFILELARSAPDSTEILSKA